MSSAGREPGSSLSAKTAAMNQFSRTALLGILVITSACSRETSSPVENQEDYARMGDIVVSQEMMDAALARIPERHRFGFIRDWQKIHEMTKDIMIYTALAQQAKDAGFSRDPIAIARMALAADKELAEAWLDHRVSTVPDADFEALAEEYYRLNPDQFMSPKSWNVTHLLLKTDTRGEDETMTLAEEYLDRARAAPEEFDEMVMQYSEDPNVESRKGHIRGARIGQMVKPFEEALKALSVPGEFSEPVVTVHGVHIIRLNSFTPSRQRPFEEVRGRLVGAQKNDYADRSRKRFAREVIEDQTFEYADGAVEALVDRYLGDEQANAPDSNSQ